MTSLFVARKRDRIDAQELLNSLLAMLLHNLDPNGNDDFLEDFKIYSCFHGKLPLFQQIQSRLYPDYYKFPIQTRARIAMDLAAYFNSPDVFWAALGDFRGDELNQTYAWSYSSYQYILFEFVAVRFGRSVFEDKETPSPREIFVPLYMSAADSQVQFDTSHSIDTWDYPFCGWQAVVRQFLGRGADPNLPFEDGKTVLLQVFVGAFTLYADERGPLWFSSLHEVVRYPDRGVQALHAWLETLQTSGVDLEEYGKIEIQVQKESSAKDIPLFSGLSYAWQEVGHLRLIAMDIGLNPRDWKFWFSDPTDQFVGEFWDMIEHPERSMPGAWDDFAWS
ncbi:hypothetical protein G7Y89_g12034 [Cudoniella acicularis]|uniref:Uncharacterized protein n=1 Tax=Cudoniella acicularis TaxID=354080 RepID=A0A8H4RCB7_9HELO|nr:hypothetical protein G7Y89_g12034 [Cudoniella acicularis]